MAKLSPAERRRAQALLEALEEFRKLDPDMQLPMAASLLLVALNDGISRTEVMDRLGVAGSTATRNLMGLMAQGRLGRRGHGLVEQRVNPHERRWRMHTLSPEGLAVVRRILAVSGGDDGQGGHGGRRGRDGHRGDDGPGCRDGQGGESAEGAAPEAFAPDAAAPSVTGETAPRAARPGGRRYG